MSRLRPTRLFGAYIFDLDGTIYLGDELLPGVRETISVLRQQNIPLRFVTNNPTKTPSVYAEKLTALGIPTARSDVVNTVVTTVGWLLANHPDATVFPIGESALTNALREAGLRLSENPAEIDIVLASYDRTFDYRKLQIAFDALWFYKRAILVQTNPDRYCPFPAGRGEPDCAAITAAITACTGVSVSANFGKPDPLMIRQALDGIQVPREDVIVIGDRLATDIQMGHSSGIASALVLTGDSTLLETEELPLAEQPTYIIDTLDALVPRSLSSS